MPLFHLFLDFSLSFLPLKSTIGHAPSLCGHPSVHPSKLQNHPSVVARGTKRQSPFGHLTNRPTDRPTDRARVPGRKLRPKIPSFRATNFSVLPLGSAQFLVLPTLDDLYLSTSLEMSGISNFDCPRSRVLVSVFESIKPVKWSLDLHCMPRRAAVPLIRFAEFALLLAYDRGSSPSFSLLSVMGLIRSSAHLVLRIPFRICLQKMHLSSVHPMSSSI